MTSIESVTLEVPDPMVANAFYTGSHRIVIGSDAAPFTDPDGFAWEAAGPREPRSAVATPASAIPQAT
jgi:hypothetical protein